MSYGLADLHLHTALGDGTVGIRELLDYVEHRTPLNLIAVTEHDDLGPSFLAKNLVCRGAHRFDVILGMEVTTLDGHLLALFIESPVPSLRSLEKTLDAVHAQGGVGIIPHPMSWLTHSVGRTVLERVTEQRPEGERFDGMELANPTLAGRVTAPKIRALNRLRYQTAETGGSDAHFLASIGTGYTLYPGKTVADLKRSLGEKTCRAGLRRPPQIHQLGYVNILRQQFRSLLVLPYRLLRRPLKNLWGSQQQ